MLIWLSIVLASGTGAWALSNHQLWLGLVSLCGAIGLVAYVGYFVSREKRSTSRTSGASAFVASRLRRDSLRPGLPAEAHASAKRA